MIKEFLQGPLFPWVLVALAMLAFAVFVYLLEWDRKRKQKLLPPSDLERVEFLRRGKDGRLWRYRLDGPDAVLWDECLRCNLRSSKGFLELNWKREEV